MKIKPNPLHASGSEDPPAELGPFWWVSEGDRHVTHQITLAEVLGLHEPEGAGVHGLTVRGSQHRLVALNTLRNALFATLRDGMPAEALATEGGDQSAFGRNARLAAQSYRMLCDRPSHDWDPGLSPVELGINNALIAARDYKHRFAGKRDETDVWWARVIAQLETALAISEARLHH